MKNIKYIIVVCIMIIACAAIFFAKSKSDTLTISNHTIHNVGDAVVHCTNNNTVDFTIDHGGDFIQSLPGVPDYVTINGYVVNRGTVATIVDSNNESLKVDWSGDPNIIVIGDTQEVN